MFRKYQLWPGIVETKGEKLFWNQTSLEIKLTHPKDTNGENSLETLMFHEDVTRKGGSDLCYIHVADQCACSSLRSSYWTLRAKQSQKISVLSEMTDRISD